MGNISLIPKRLASFFRFVIFGGLEDIKDPFEYSSVAICNMLGFMALSVSAFFTIFHAVFTRDVIGVISAAINCPTFFFALYQNHHKKYRFARYLLTLAAKFGLTFAVFFLGRESSVSVLF